MRHEISDPEKHCAFLWSAFEGMFLAISDGMSYEDLPAMADLKAEDMPAFRLKKKVS